MALALPAALVFALIALTGGASAADGPADLALTKSDSPDPVTVGGTLTYTIKVQNLDLANDATLVKVTDVLSKDVTFTSATASVGSCQQQAGTVTCDLGTVNAGVTATATIVVKPKKTGTLSNTASVTTTQVDANAANNQATATTVVTKAAATTKPKKGKKNKASCATPTIVGTAGNDVLVGTNGADVIASLDGNDQVSAAGGKDLICAGSGADTVFGGSAGDTVIGGPGPDKLVGSSGNDLLKGKRGRDRLRGNGGNDFLSGGRNHDKCRGGAGHDTLKSCP